MSGRLVVTALRHVPLHRWRAMKWGATPRYAADLDCRECRICGRFEIWAYWSYSQRDRADFPDAVPA